MVIHCQQFWMRQPILHCQHAAAHLAALFLDTILPNLDRHVFLKAPIPSAGKPSLVGLKDQKAHVFIEYCCNCNYERLQWREN